MLVCRCACHRGSIIHVAPDIRNVVEALAACDRCRIEHRALGVHVKVAQQQADGDPFNPEGSET